MDMGSIANLHLAFNIACTALLLPFHRQLVKLVKAVVPGDAEERELSVLDDRFLSSPSLAAGAGPRCGGAESEFAGINYRLAVELIWKFDCQESWSGSTKPRWRWTSWRVCWTTIWSSSPTGR